MCDPIDGSPPGYPIPGILQARTLEWGAIAFSLLAVRKTETQTITMSVPSLPCIRLVNFERMIVTIIVGGEINTHNLFVEVRFRSVYLILNPGGSDSKEPACNVGDPGSIPGLQRSPGEGNGLPIPVFLPGESQGWGSLVGCHLWGCTELDTTEVT